MHTPHPQPVAPTEHCGECADPIDAGDLCVECALEAVRLAVRETCPYVTLDDESETSLERDEDGD